MFCIQFKLEKFMKHKNSRITDLNTEVKKNRQTNRRKAK